MSLFKKTILRLLILLLLTTGSSLFFHNRIFAQTQGLVAATPTSATCTFNNPEVVLVTDQGAVVGETITREGRIGDQRTFNIRVKNNNTGVGCTPTKFSLTTTGTHPNFTIVSIPTETPAIGNGGTQVISYKVTPNCGVQAGLRTFNVTVANSDRPNKVDGVTPKYNVTDASCTPPTASPLPTNTPGCVLNTPTVVIVRNDNTTTNTLTKQGGVGEKKNFQIRVTNNNVGAGCPTDTFTLATTDGTHPNFTVESDQPNGIPLTNNHNGSFNYDVTPKCNVTAGNHNFTVTVSNNRGAKRASVIPVYNVTSTSCPSPSPSVSPTTTPAPCTYNSPHLQIVREDGTVEPSDLIKEGEIGKQRDFQIRVKNKNSGAGCAPTAFTLTTTGAHPNFTVAPDPVQTPAIANEATTIIHYRVTPTCGASQSLHTFNVSVANKDKPHKVDSVTPRYNVTDNRCAPPPGCVVNNPEAVLVTDQGVLIGETVTRGGKVGEERTFNVRVTNNNRGRDCTPTKFVLTTAGGHPNFTVTDPIETPAIGNGGNKVVSYKVTPTCGATAGLHTFNVTVKNKDVPSKTDPVTPKYNVTDASCSTACVKKTPQLTTTQDKVSVAPGGKITYTLSVKNIDEGNCQDRNLNFTNTTPNANWRSTYTPGANMVVAKGATKTITLGVTSPTSASVEKKVIHLTAKNNNGVEQLKRDLDFVVANPTACVKKTPGLTVTTDKPSTPPGGAITYKLTVKNLDEGNCEARNLNFTNTTPNTNWGSQYTPGANIVVPLNGTTVLNLKVTSPTSASVEKKVIHLTAKNNNGVVQLTKDLDFVVSNTNPSPTPSPTQTPTPTGSPAPTVTPGPHNFSMSFTMGLDGIGRTGDNTTPQLDGGNHNPQPDSVRTKTLKVEMFDVEDGNKALKPVNAPIKYQTSGPTEGLYISNELPVPFPDDFNHDHTRYVIKLSVPGYLRREVGKATNQSVQNITPQPGRNFNVPQTTLIVGDVNHDNFLSALDYNAIINCSIYTFNPGACSNRAAADLNADQVVNTTDINYFLRERQVQNGD